jgi:uncharacterized protein (TIGR00369 family)
MIFWKKPISINILNQMIQDTIDTTLGIEFLTIGDTSITARMPVDKRTCQAWGRLHGGANLVLAETLASYATYFATDTDVRCVGLEINANHLLGVRRGFVTGTASPLYLGQSTQVWSVEIKNESGKLSCISRVTMSTFKRKSKNS